ncbi:hypothetical protein [Gordonia otitidis]|uniref:Uncharacterized protein n=1 Tax=Gordonia otitidis (strain DSM 44809 / CCUG 52243 / JCM 12355 / NBRC 100426 / IFM 10032) TaxID=1108044 RepID=H5TIA8_GORO1|nr:hypothetical protein [Gordonia otitidis]GAB33216.1 hypothetical protein GOOTI_051_00070 [Gordonia otitidis NBRC 100426]
MATEGRDYTGIVRFQGKLFNISDISLAGVGGITLPALTMAAIPAFIIALLIFITVMIVSSASMGFLVASLMFFLVGIPLYVWFNRDSADREKPWLRAKLWVAARLTQPTHIAERGKDTLADDLCWQVVVPRPAGSPHIHAGRALRSWGVYWPQPKESPEFVVHNDFHIFDQWYERLGKLAEADGGGKS